MKKKNIMLSLFIALIGGLALVCLPQVLMAEDAPATTVFVDLDGDGFDDNCADEDNDGIPNEADSDFEPMAADHCQDLGENIIDFGATIKAIGLSADLTTNSQRLGIRQFRTRNLIMNRCGFDSNCGFGSGNEIGIGVSSGGGCAGGVCGG